MFAFLQVFDFCGNCCLRFLDEKSTGTVKVEMLVRINVCKQIKNAKFAKINSSQTFLILRY